jgi:hypothetical protein
MWIYYSSCCDEVIVIKYQESGAFKSMECSKCGKVCLIRRIEKETEATLRKDAI